MTLTEFLLARIAEDEAVARQTNPHHNDDDVDWDALTDAAVRWDRQPHGQRCAWRLGEGMADKCRCGYPARVLAECEAKRLIVEHARGPEPRSVRETADGAMAYDYGDVLHFAPKDTPPDLVLRLLALPYADHPDYDEKWRP